MSEPVPLFRSRPLNLALRPVAPSDHDPQAKPFLHWAGGKGSSTPPALHARIGDGGFHGVHR